MHEEDRVLEAVELALRQARLSLLRVRVRVRSRSRGRVRSRGRGNGRRRAVGLEDSPLQHPLALRGRLGVEG